MRKTVKYNQAVKLLIALTIFFIMSSSVFAGPIIKMYGKTEDYTKNYINKYDLKGLKYILVYPDDYSRYWLGYYYPYQIRMYSNSEEVFVHELAHHYYYLESGDFVNHPGRFWDIYGHINKNRTNEEI